VTVEEARTLVAALKAAFPRQPVEEETVAVYVQMLRDLPTTDGQQAVEALLKRSRFFPTISEIREAVLDVWLPLPTPVQAWELVEEAGRIAMREGRPGEDDGLMRSALPPLVWRALRAVGGELGYRYSENVNALRAQFLRVYAELRESAVAGGEETRRAAIDPAERAEIEAARHPVPMLRSLEP
jgi:hypothetical protein